MENWQLFEEHVQTVYQMLLNMKGEGVIVARDVQMLGRDGLSHQVDVYYEFDRAGVRHRVAIECKNTARPVGKDRVMAFKAKVDDMVDVKGVIVSASGFQAGASKYAEDNGVVAISVDALPSMGRLLAGRLESFMLPDEGVVGEPFWTIYGVRDGKNTGAIYGVSNGSKLLAPLFFSKLKATAFLRDKASSVGWGVRGLSQRHLRSFIITVEACEGEFIIVDGTGIERVEQKWAGVKILRSKLIDEFYVASNPIPEPIRVVSR